MTLSLLESSDPSPVCEFGVEAGSDFLIIVDHASAAIPQRLGNLGLTSPDLRRHIALDIGALEVARRVGVNLNARVIAQNYSRLVIDCNRDPTSAASIPQLSEHTRIPGNMNLSADNIRLRRREIFDPYHDYITEVIDSRQRNGRRTMLIFQHSMTDVYMGVARPMHAAVLYGRDRRFALETLRALRKESRLVVGDNVPYAVTDDTDYSVRRHAETRRLMYVELEVRQDLIAAAGGQDEWAARLTKALLEAHGLSHFAAPPG